MVATGIYHAVGPLEFYQTYRDTAQVMEMLWRWIGVMGPFKKGSYSTPLGGYRGYYRVLSAVRGVPNYVWVFKRAGHEVYYLFGPNSKVPSLIGMLKARGPAGKPEFSLNSSHCYVGVARVPVFVLEPEHTFIMVSPLRFITDRVNRNREREELRQRGDIRHYVSTGTAPHNPMVWNRPGAFVRRPGKKTFKNMTWRRK